MKSKSFMLMILSMGFGLIAAIGISQVMRTSKAAPTPVTKMGPVLVAADILDMHEVLTEENVKIENWPKSIIPENAVTKIEAIKDMATLSRMAKGMPIVKGNIDNKEKIGGLAIPDGYKVVALKVSGDDMIGGLLQAGDTIDVIGYFKRKTREGTRQVARTFMKGIKVFSVGNKMQAADNRQEGKSSRSAIVGVLVTEKQSEELFFVQKTADIKLVLRGNAVADDEEVDDISDIVSWGQGEKEELEEEQPQQSEEIFVVNSPAPPKTKMTVWLGPEPAQFSFEDGELPVNLTRLPTPNFEDDEEDLTNFDDEPEIDEKSNPYEKGESTLSDEIDRGLEQDKYPGA